MCISFPASNYGRPESPSLTHGLLTFTRYNVAGFACMPNRPFEVEHSRWPVAVRYALVCAFVVGSALVAVRFHSCATPSPKPVPPPGLAWRDPTPDEMRWIRTRPEDIERLDDQEDQADAWDDLLNQLSAKQISVDADAAQTGAILRLNNRLNRRISRYF